MKEVHITQEIPRELSICGQRPNIRTDDSSSTLFARVLGALYVDCIISYKLCLEILPCLVVETIFQAVCQNTQSAIPFHHKTRIFWISNNTDMHC